MHTKWINDSPNLIEFNSSTNIGARGILGVSGVRWEIFEDNRKEGHGKYATRFNSSRSINGFKQKHS